MLRRVKARKPKKTKCTAVRAGSCHRNGDSMRSAAVGCERTCVQTGAHMISEQKVASGDLAFPIAHGAFGVTLLQTDLTAASASTSGLRGMQQMREKESEHSECWINK